MDLDKTIVRPKNRYKKVESQVSDLLKELKVFPDSLEKLKVFCGHIEELKVFFGHKGKLMVFSGPKEVLLWSARKVERYFMTASKNCRSSLVSKNS